MNKVKNQKGITLVELIASLALVSLVALLIMTTLSIGIKHSVVESDRVRVQQEANLIVSKLLYTHRVGDAYCLLSFVDKDVQGNDFNNLSYGLDCANKTNKLFDQSSSFEISSINLGLLDQKQVTPDSENIKINMTIKYRDQKKKSTYLIDTTLTRFKTN